MTQQSNVGSRRSNHGSVQSLPTGRRESTSSVALARFKEQTTSILRQFKALNKASTPEAEQFAGWTRDEAKAYLRGQFRILVSQARTLQESFDPYATFEPNAYRPDKVRWILSKSPAPTPTVKPRYGQLNDIYQDIRSLGVMLEMIHTSRDANEITIVNLLLQAEGHRLLSRWSGS